MLGGKSVARGYYKNEEKTEEDFFTENGMRFLIQKRVGDLVIGFISAENIDLIFMYGAKHNSFSRL